MSRNDPRALQLDEVLCRLTLPEKFGVTHVYQICHRYESGFGHGIKKDGIDLSRTPHSDPDLAEAYQIGYEAGLKRHNEEREAALQELATMAQELDMGYGSIQRNWKPFPELPPDANTKVLVELKNGTRTFAELRSFSYKDDTMYGTLSFSWYRHNEKLCDWDEVVCWTNIDQESENEK